MKILYAVDLHGYPQCFERIFQAATDFGVEAVISPVPSLKMKRLLE